MFLVCFIYQYKYMFLFVFLFYFIIGAFFFNFLKILFVREKGVLKYCN
ncbi:hypothetical protein HPTD01_1893 [Halomonas sp. TD01]|nr:hypothetical protein HPTD01_1893 [Halomonas sp. TD01]